MKNRYEKKINNFLKKIKYDEIYKEEIMRRIRLKGLYIFEKIYDFLKNIGIEEISYNILYSVYIYDKRLRTTLFKYFSFIEDYFRSKLFEYYENNLSDDNSKRIEKVLKLHLIDLINEYTDIWDINFNNKRELNKLRNDVFHSKFILINNDNYLNEERIESIRTLCSIIEDEEIQNEYNKEINTLSKFNKDNRYRFSDFELPKNLIIRI